jgi:uncharacterized delta-60 repeat protein
MNSRILQLASLSIFSILLTVSQQAAAQAGHLDPTFGNGGIVTTDFGDHSNSNVASANAVTIQADGKILVSGGIPSGNGFPSPAVARYNTNGSLDTTFGSSGVASISSIEDVPLTSIALQTDGRIVAAGVNIVVRFLPTGVLDSTFGSGGIVSLGNDFLGEPATGIAIQPDGKLLLANRYLLRFLSDGQFDTSFGSGGTARTAGYPATGLALLPNGKILASSSAIASGFISQYDSNGTLDTTFGIGGQLASPGTATGLAILGTGDFLSGGSLTNNSVLPISGIAAANFAVSRYLSAGVTDASFGSNGGTVTTVPGFPTVATSGLAVEPNGDIVILGNATRSPQTVFALARYTPTGQLDTTFGNNGTVETVFALGTSVSANGLAIQSDGKILAVGGYTFSVPHGAFDTGFKVIRYLGQ